ncbi:MAG: SDR family NAD(P)-dependent oxidoreductase [Parvularculaceae bacterium]|nr:SDR family NAD(P)-dependent oxidoreductase [Parvularculaceae bacterium]
MKAKTLKRWLITGVSSGLGAALSKAALSRGDAVLGTVRKAKDGKAFVARGGANAYASVCDIADPAQTRDAVATAVKTMGGVDILVNNAGYCLTGPFEEISNEEARRQLDVNLFGALNLIRNILPHYRSAGGGRIINITSLAAETGFPGMSLYSASKAALHMFSEALAKETAAFGVKVTAVAPSGFRTQFAGSSMQFSDAKLECYNGLRDKLEVRLKVSNGAQPNDPEKAANALLGLADDPDPPTFYALGADAAERLSVMLDNRVAAYNESHRLGADTLCE